MSLNGQNNTQNVLQAYLNRLQELENAAFYLLSCMSIGAAFGDLLNKLGNLVGEARQGRSDADYQAGIRLRIRVNISSGRAADILAVAALANPGVTPVYVENYPATWMIDMLQVPSPPVVAGKLTHTRSAGTAGMLIYTPTSTSPPFIGDSGYGNDVPNAGRGDSGYGSDVTTPGVGGGAFAV